MGEHAEQIGTVDRGGPGSRVLGTRFRIYPQAPYVAGYETPETVWISTPPDQIRVGPEDHRIYVRDPLLAKEPYEYPYLPPFVGEVFPPAEPAFDGHFDQIPLNSRRFLAAHAFASVSRVLDIWESYIGRPTVWHFAETYERLEIIPRIDWNNAQSGYGFLELGQDRGLDGQAHPFALNFDVIAHEVGHAILFSLIDVPEKGLRQADYASFHETSADLISLLSFLHFDSGLDRLLRHCNGNLLILNELNRIGELVGDRQVRLASNSRRLSEVTDELHDRSRPFTGAVFDTIVDNYHARLVAEGLADERLLELDIRTVSQTAMQKISDFTARAFRARPFLFKSALTRARDDVALVLARAWLLLDVDNLTFESAGISLINASKPIDAFLATKLEENLSWREII